MKLKIFDRFIFAVLVLCIAAVSIAAIGLAWDILSVTVVSEYITLVGTLFFNRVLITVVALLVFILCMRLLFVRERMDVSPMTHGIVIRTGDNGTACITKAALEGIVLKFVRSNSKVRDCKCDIMPGQEFVSIGLRLHLMPGVNIPELAKELQESLKENIELLTGISVRDIPIVIESASSITPGRVN